MADSEPHSPNTGSDDGRGPPSINTHLDVPGPASIITQGDANNLSPRSMERQLSFLEMSKTGWYQPQPPLGFAIFEETFHLGSTFGVSVDLHVTMIYYIIIEIIWALLHYNQEPFFYLLYVVIVFIFQCLALYIHMIATLLCAQKVRANIHRVIIWPFGTMGYSSNYKKWKPLLLTLYMGPLIHIIFIAIWATLGIVSKSLFSSIDTNLQWRLANPMSKNLLINICNGSWAVNGVILVLHCCMPIYSFKAGRLLTSVLYRTRKIKAIADILLMPHTFMSIIILIVGIIDLRPMTIFASVWSMYQTYLLWRAKRLDMFDRLPMFNCLEDQLRSQETLRKLRRKQEKLDAKNSRATLLNEGNDTSSPKGHGSNINSGQSSAKTSGTASNVAIEITAPQPRSANNDNNDSTNNNDSAGAVESKDNKNIDQTSNNKNQGNAGKAGNGNDEFEQVDVN